MDQTLNVEGMRNIFFRLLGLGKANDLALSHPPVQMRHWDRAGAAPASSEPLFYSVLMANLVTAIFAEILLNIG